LWCADGDICRVPVGNKGIEAPSIKVNKIQIGDWFLETHAGSGNLHVHRGNVDEWYTSIGKDNQVLATRKIWNESNIINDRNITKLSDDFYWTLDNNMVRRDKTYEIKSQHPQNRKCLDAGPGGNHGCNWDNEWRRFSIVQTPHNRND
jgi:hypothetical protein